ncbi:MAG: CBS domain-containing protein [Candidatus Bathyarchaeota archaeon]|nr:MAG: CBS domain-containing protein [Candidatus Bathyarchaeota archaeon]
MWKKTAEIYLDYHLEGFDELMSGTLMVRDVMTTAVKTVRIDTSVRDAVRKMNKFFIGSILIVDEKRLVGILTERDILRRIVEQGTDASIIRVKDIMSSPVITVHPETNIEDAAQLMTQKQIKKLPVMEEGKLVGVVTSMDLMQAAPTIVKLLEDLLRREI